MVIKINEHIINIHILPLFRQKINENIYHFDIVGINEESYQSYTLGYVIMNSETGKLNCILPEFLNYSLSENFLNTIKTIVNCIECTGSD